MVHKYKNTVKIPVIDFFRPKNHFEPIKNERMSLEKESFVVALSLSVSLSHFSFVSTCVHPGELVELRMSWFTLTEDLGWGEPLPSGAKQLLFRYAHMSPSVTAAVRQPYAQDLYSLDPSDTGPPYRYVDVAAFARWAEHRRCGPNPGVLLAKALFGFPPDARRMGSLAPPAWANAVARLRPALAILCIAIDDVRVGDLGADLSGALTMDVVWFMARSAMILAWLDWDRVSRLDSTRALAVMPLCREVTEMATRRLAMGKGLNARVAASWQRVLCQALSDNEDDTPFNRGIIAEMEQEAADPESWPPSPPRTPESAGSWEQDRNEALAYRTRDEAAAEESSSSPSL